METVFQQNSFFEKGIEMPVLKPDLEARLRSAVTELNVTWDEARPEPLGKGRINQTFSISLGGRRLALRLNDTEASGLTLDRDVEYKAHLAAAAAGVAPAIHLRGATFLCMEIVPGRHPGEADYQDEETVRAVARSIAMLHSCPRLDRDWHALDSIRWHATQMQSRGVLTPELQKGYEAVLALNPRERLERFPLVPGHNDLHAENILVGSARPMFIDFELTTMQSPFFDLAGVGISLEERLREALLAEYFGVPLPSEEHRFQINLATLMVHLKSALLASAAGRLEETEGLLSKFQDVLKNVHP